MKTIEEQYVEQFGDMPTVMDLTEKQMATLERVLRVALERGTPVTSADFGLEEPPDGALI